MQLVISYRHLESTPSIQEKIEEKMGHLDKFLNGNGHTHWVCSVDGHDQHTSEVQVKVDGGEFHAHATDKNLYHTFDMVISKLESQMRKKQR